jgi:hypothetical protein
MNKPIPKLTDRQLRNFWLKVDKRGPDECWPWLASGNVRGYGQFGLLPAGIFSAHRVAYYLATGKQPGPLCACHTCDNPSCCNPAHLFLGTDADNVADKVAKGRCAAGVNHGRAKLTEEQVLEIRAVNETQVVIAAKYGVSRGLVSRVRSRRNWKHI